jgi:hypothetical protein
VARDALQESQGEPTSSDEGDDAAAEPSARAVVAEQELIDAVSEQHECRPAERDHRDRVVERNGQMVGSDEVRSTAPDETDGAEREETENTDGKAVPDHFPIVMFRCCLFTGAGVRFVFEVVGASSGAVTRAGRIARDEVPSSDKSKHGCDPTAHADSDKRDRAKDDRPTDQLHQKSSHSERNPRVGTPLQDRSQHLHTTPTVRRRRRRTITADRARMTDPERAI